jgi:MbtH protein
MGTDSNDIGDGTLYDVVVNDEEQYSVWLADQPLPRGWSSVGFRASKDECLDHIEKIWLDMRPRSVREAMWRGE